MPFLRISDSSDISLPFMLKWKTPEEKFLLEERRAPPGPGWAAAMQPGLAQLRSLLTPHARRGRAAALQGAINSPAARKKSKFPSRTPRGDRKTSKPVTRQPLPIRWELEQAPAASNK